MTKRESEDWKKRKRLEETGGYEFTPWQGVHVHSANTAKHEFVKWALCYLLDSKGREWDAEVTCDTGRVDVYDAGPVDGRPVVYEVETGVTDAQARQKREQYQVGPIRDVIVIDPADVPDAPEAAIEYLDERVVLG